MNFLQSIKAGKPTPEAHQNLLRFGRGAFDREQITIRKTKKHIDVASGFEYYLTLYRMFLELTEQEEIEANGVIVGPKQQIQSMLDEMNIQPTKTFGKKFTIKYVAQRSELKELADRIADTSGALLLTLKANGVELKSKTTFPKPGKLVEKFARLKAPLKFEKRIRDAFMIPEFEKRVTIETVYDIKNIHFDEAMLEKDPARARRESTRDVEVTRKITIDKDEAYEETFRAVV